MLTEYIERAMSKATYDKLEDDNYCGRIPECPGTIAFGKTLCRCQDELRSVLEGWLLVKIRHGDHLPVVDCHLDFDTWNSASGIAASQLHRGSQ